MYVTAFAACRLRRCVCADCHRLAGYPAGVCGAAAGAVPHHQRPGAVQQASEHGAAASHHRQEAAAFPDDCSQLLRADRGCTAATRALPFGTSNKLRCGLPSLPRQAYMQAHARRCFQGKKPLHPLGRFFMRRSIPKPTPFSRPRGSRTDHSEAACWRHSGVTVRLKSTPPTNIGMCAVANTT